MANILPHLEDRTAYFIWDKDYSTTREVWNNFGTTINYVNGFPASTPEEMVASWDTSAETGAICKADTLEELLGMLEGLDVETAKKTLENWNTYCENGLDEEFQLNPAMLYPVKNGPFYGVKITPASCMFLTVMGGLRTNSNLQVCDADDQPIEGLYCVGTMVGDFFKNLYTFNVFGQNLGATCCTLPYLLASDLAAL